MDLIRAPIAAAQSALFVGTVASGFNQTQTFGVTFPVAEALEENRQTSKENMRPDWNGRPGACSSATGAYL